MLWQARTIDELHGLKLFWGTVFAAVFLCLVLAFAIRAIRARGVKYNWPAVLASFSAIGLVIYLMFFMQV